MFSDEEIKETQEGGFMRPGDEIISVREICLDKFDSKLIYKNDDILPNPSKYFLDLFRSVFRDGFFPESGDQAKFAWTEEDGNIASLVSEPGFGTTGNTTFGKDLEAELKNEVKDENESVPVPSSSTTTSDMSFFNKLFGEPPAVSSTSGSNPAKPTYRRKGQPACKVDKTDPRSRLHYVKYLKRQGRTVKLWECGICGREFQHQYTLMRHLPTHTDERNYHCTRCGKSFRQLSTLSQHKAIHSADRPYSCEVCNKTFNRVSTLISHRKTHSDEKPYKCHICPKGFHQKGNLRNHLFTHTNERPYRCNICFKGFNQQSNLVCHKNKTHPDENTIINAPNERLPPPLIPKPTARSQPDSTISIPEHCEVSSSVGPYLPSTEGPSSSTWTPTNKSSWHTPRSAECLSNDWTNTEVLGSMVASGVIVEPINTYHMGVALATRQTPFALLKPDNGAPVLVKVVDTKLPNGKQMLVPATAEDLRIGGKLVLQNDENVNVHNNQDVQVNCSAESSVQIRVPVVATVVPRLRPGGGLQLTVEEPHHGYHTNLAGADVSGPKVDACDIPSVSHSNQLAAPYQRPNVLKRLDQPASSLGDQALRAGGSLSSPCALPPPAPSPPLDLISLDLFETMECLPLGPQITAVDNIDQRPSDDSDIFIGEFEECIALSDSD